MENKMFNNFNLTNKEIKKILEKFDGEIKNSIYKTIGRKDDDYEQTIRLEIIKTLSKNRKIKKN